MLWTTCKTTLSFTGNAGRSLQIRAGGFDLCGTPKKNVKPGLSRSTQLGESADADKSLG